MSHSSQIKALIEAGEWEAAICRAAAFPHLGSPESKAAILRGREAIQRPDFMRQLNRCPAAAIEAAKAAMQARFA